MPGSNIEMFFPNTIVNLLKTNGWKELLEIMGDSLLYYLLTNCILFHRFLRISTIKMSKFSNSFSRKRKYQIRKEILLQYNGPPFSIFLSQKNSYYFPLWKRSFHTSYYLFKQRLIQQKLELLSVDPPEKIINNNIDNNNINNNHNNNNNNNK